MNSRICLKLNGPYTAGCVGGPSAFTGLGAAAKIVREQERRISREGCSRERARDRRVASKTSTSVSSTRKASKRRDIITAPKYLH